MPQDKRLHSHRWQGIQGRLILLLFFVLIPILIFQAYLYYDRFRTRLAEELQANIEIAHATRGMIEELVNDVLRQQMAIGVTLTLYEHLSVERINEILAGSTAEYPAIRNFGWISPQGRVIASDLLSSIGADVSDRTYINDIMRGKDWRISDLLQSKTTGKPVFAVARAVRHSDGTLQGIVVAMIDPERLDKVLAFHRAAGGCISLVDSKGMLVYRYPRTEVAWEERNWLGIHPGIEDALKGNELSSTIMATHEEKSRIAALSPTSFGWVVCAGRGKDEVIAPIVTSLVRSGILFLSVAVAAFFIALAISRIITSHVIALRAHALALGRGEYREQASICHISEFQDLADAFNAMAEKVRLREIALLQSETDLNRAQTVARTGSWRLDVGHNELLWSDETHRIFGIPKGTPLMYETFLSAVHPEDRGYVDRSWTAALRGERYDIEHRIVVGDKVRWVREQAELELDREGVVLDGFGTVQDITERKAVEEALRDSEARFRLLSETAGRLLAAEDPQAIVNDLCRLVMEHLDCQTCFNFLIEEQSRKLRLNVCAGIPEEEVRKIEQRSHGMSLSGCVAQDGVEIVADDILNIPNPRTDLVRSYGIQAYACHPLKAQGQIIGTLSFGTKTRAHFSPQELALMKTVADQVSTAIERMRLVERLQRSRNELETRVQERTAELKKMNAELKTQTILLEQSNQALTDFASIASHDLQEPLRKVMTFGRMLMDSCADSIGEEGKDYLTRIFSATDRMQTLIRSLLQYSRVTSRAKPFTKVELSSIAREVLLDLEVRIEMTGGVVHLGELPIIQADPMQMRQLFQNLIGNGLKFHKEGERPIVQVRSTMIDNQITQIVVEDNGIGFDSKYQDKIFAPFQRLHGRDSQYEGTGMGLAICKKIVERHGGSITAKSAPGRGAAFIVRLPVRSSRIEGSEIQEPGCN